MSAITTKTNANNRVEHHAQSAMSLRVWLDGTVIGGDG